MDKYKVETPREFYTVEADSSNKARKEIMKAEKIIMEKGENFDDETYYQRSDRYKGKKLGKSNTSMQNYGCALFCWAKCFNLDPLKVNELFIKKGVYSNDLIIFSKACEVLGGKDYYKDTNINNMPSQKETIKEVRLGKGQHFVVRYNKNGSRWIFDPWTGQDKSINYYSFRSYRIFNK